MTRTISCLLLLLCGFAITQDAPKPIPDLIDLKGFEKAGFDIENLRTERELTQDRYWELKHPPTVDSALIHAPFAALLSPANAPAQHQAIVPLEGAPTQATQAIANPLIDFGGFMKLSAEIDTLRKGRRLTLPQFVEMATEPKTIILDTRSKAAFDRKHIKGAVHLNFSDFTDEKLKKVIPDPTTRVLIYCNNNFMATRDSAFPAKELRLALNIPTFINLVGYGYKNVYELGPVVPENDPLLAFAGTDMM